MPSHLPRLTMLWWVGNLALSVGALPLLWLALLHANGRRSDAAYWWMAAAFGVSVLADSFPHPLAHQVYPVGQAALFALVLLPRREALMVVGVLLACASSSIVLRSGAGLDVLLRVVAWGTVAGLAWQIPRGPLRYALGLGFAAMTVGWLWYVLAAGWASWLALQSARVLTTLAWGYAAYKASERVNG